jgi:predicted ATPase
VLGSPDQSLQQGYEALTLAQGLTHPYSLSHALSFAAWLHQFRGEGPRAQELAEAAVTLSTEQGFTYYVAMGMILRGAALAEQGQAEEGVAQMRQGLRAAQAQGAALSRPHYLALLARAYGKGGHAEEGLRVLAEALMLVHTTAEHWWEAELYRLKGELLLMCAAENLTEAEASFHQALTLARRQQARSLELRAAMSLSRLWQQQGKRAEASMLLAPVYGWFTEGFDTADLQEARTLLEELAG